MRWEHFEHGADVGVRGIGASPSEAFEGAAAALCALISGGASRVRPEREEAIVCEAPDPESLLVHFLNELIYRMSAHRMVYGEFSASVTDSPGGGGWTVRARIRGEPFDPERHEPTVEPKGATFTLASVREETGEWKAQCVVDV